MKIADNTKKKMGQKSYLSCLCIGLCFSILLLFFSLGQEFNSRAARNISGPTVDVHSGLVTYHYVYLGYYPQSEVTSDEMTKEIVNASYDSNDIAVVGDTSYKRVLSSQDSYSYFVVEPIKWRILENDGTYLTLQSAQILDCMEYDGNNTTRYDDCSLRTWLNSDFLRAAFVDGADSGLKTVYGEDWITLPAAEDIENENYGMSTESCVLTVSDYAVNQGCYSANFTGSSSGAYWVRSSDSSSRYVDCIGEMQPKIASDTDCGVAPVIRISAEEYYYSTEEPLLHNPEVNPQDGSTTWDVVYFGSYPQTEIVHPEEAVIQGNYQDDVAVVDGVRYKRIPENNAYRYFRFDAIRWRVLKSDGGKYLLQCDSILEMYQRNTISDDVRYQDSDLCKWLNNEFLETAFSSRISKSLIEDEYGNYVDMISDELMQSVECGYQNDSSRILSPSAYAEAVSHIGKEESAVCWFRSAESDINGYINNKGSMIYYTPTGIKGICPVIRMNEIPYVWSVSEDSVILPPLGTEVPIPDHSITPVETQYPSGTAAPAETQQPSEAVKNPDVTPIASPSKAPEKYFTTKRPAVSVSSNNATSHKLCWKKIAGATGYSIYRSTKGEGTYHLCSTVSKTTALVKNLKKGRKYYYVVIAYQSSHGELSYSKPSRVVSRQAGSPGKPQITVTMTKNRGKKYVTIHWQKVSDAKFIQLYRSKSGSKYESILDAKISKYKKGVTVSYVYARGTYRFKIRSYNQYKGKKLYSDYSKIKKVRL